MQQLKGKTIVDVQQLEVWDATGEQGRQIVQLKFDDGTSADLIAFDGLEERYYSCIDILSDEDRAEIEDPINGYVVRLGE